MITSADTERSAGWHRRLREAHIPGIRGGGATVPSDLSEGEPRNDETRERHYRFGERWYIASSFIAKSALAWQVFANILVD